MKSLGPLHTIPTNDFFLDRCEIASSTKLTHGEVARSDSSREKFIPRECADFLRWPCSSVDVAQNAVSDLQSVLLGIHLSVVGAGIHLFTNVHHSRVWGLSKQITYCPLSDQTLKIAVIGGCREYTGAPYFAAISALKIVSASALFFFAIVCGVFFLVPLSNFRRICVGDEDQASISSKTTIQEMDVVFAPPAVRHALVLWY